MRVNGALQEEAIMSETREGLESKGGGGRSDAEDSVRAEAGAAAAEDEVDLLQKNGCPE